MAKKKPKAPPTRPAPITREELERYAESLVTRGLASHVILERSRTFYQREFRK